MDYRFTVLTTRCILAALCLIASSYPVFGQAAANVSLTPIPAATTDQSTSGSELMNQVVQQMDQHNTVSAKIRHRSAMFGQRLVGSGVYLQSGGGSRLQVRFSLSVKTGDRMVSLLHVCDGRTLWMFDNLDGREKLSRVDLLRLRQAAAKQGGELMPIMLGGGLPQLLGSLRENFIASPPQSITFQEVPVWAIALRWNPQRLAQLLGRDDLFDDQRRLRTDQLPEQVPDRVFLFVGQDDYFPYHIDFRKSTKQELLSSATVGKMSTSESLTTMELFEVQFNAALDPMLFVYKPGNIEIEDQTDDYLARLQPPSAR